MSEDVDTGTPEGRGAEPLPEELADRLDELQESEETVTEQDETGSPAMVQRGGTAFGGDARQDPNEQAGGGQAGG
ncbi:MAG: hypothetical protein M3N68_12710 [Actinomycetota bacterium]|nr:hypothetical protein [Actinomycetota bacterium]